MKLVIKCDVHWGVGKLCDPVTQGRFEKCLI